MSKIRLLIIDDSALIRHMLKTIFNADNDIEVVGTAADPLIAREKIKQLKPDVLTLDVEMPRMDGLTFLRNLMRLKPMPVVMVSAMTEAGAAVTLEALEIGAVDFIAKPKEDISNTLNQYAEELISKVKMASRVQLHSIIGNKALLNPASFGDKVAIPQKVDIGSNSECVKRNKLYQIIAIGSSTGGTEALKRLVNGLPANAPAILIAQHLPSAFSQSFAKHMNEVTAMNVSIAKHGVTILPGHVYIAPGDRHLKIAKQGLNFVCQLDDGDKVNRHKPSVDVLFRSVASNVGKNAIGIMLTGMGNDGAEAMGVMKQAGSVNIIQDQASSVVWGMPGEVYKQGFADIVLPLNNIAAQVIELVK